MPFELPPQFPPPPPAIVWEAPGYGAKTTAQRGPTIGNDLISASVYGINYRTLSYDNEYSNQEVAAEVGPLDYQETQMLYEGIIRDAATTNLEFAEADGNTSYSEFAAEFGVSVNSLLLANGLGGPNSSRDALRKPPPGVNIIRPFRWAPQTEVLLKKLLDFYEVLGEQVYGPMISNNTKLGLMDGFKLSDMPVFPYVANGQYTSDQSKVLSEEGYRAHYYDVTSPGADGPHGIFLDTRYIGVVEAIGHESGHILQDSREEFWKLNFGPLMPPDSGFYESDIVTALADAARMHPQNKVYVDMEGIVWHRNNSPDIFKGSSVQPYLSQRFLPRLIEEDPTILRLFTEEVYYRRGREAFQTPWNTTDALNALQAVHKSAKAKYREFSTSNKMVAGLNP